MNLSFKDFYSPEPVVEVSQTYINKLHPNLQKLLDEDKLPFNHIFGRKLRIAESLNGGTEYETNITRHLSDYDVDFPSWTGYKKNDTTKKNPVKIGKALNKRREELTKRLKDPELDQASRDAFNQQFLEVDKLLKISNIQQQWENARRTAYVIIYSRAPIDVLRMGDFDWQTYSCHAPKGDYFKCAIADAMLNAGVIYLIREDDYKTIDNLQEEEIFADNDRDIDGINPVARMRIRAAIDENGETLAVPTTKIYAVKGQQFNDEFKKQVIQWAKNQDVSKFDWATTLTMPGGTYEDYKYELDTMIKEIWGKSVTYKHDASDEEPDENDEDEWAQAEEHYYDECRGEIDISKIQDEIFDGENPDRIIETGIDYNGGDYPTIEFSFNLSECPQFKDIEKKPKTVRNGAITFGTYFVTVKLRGDYVGLHDYIHFDGPADNGYSNSFDVDELHHDVADKLQYAIRTFTGSGFSFNEGEGELIRLKWELINTILKAYELPPIKLSHEDDMRFFVKTFMDKSIDITEQVTLPIHHHPLLNYEFKYKWLKVGMTQRDDGIPQGLFHQFADMVEALENNLAEWNNRLCTFLSKRYNLDLDLLQNNLMPHIYCEKYKGHYNTYDHSEGWKNTKLKQLIFNFANNVAHPMLAFALRMDVNDVNHIIGAGELANYMRMILDLIDPDFYIKEDFPDEAIGQLYYDQQGPLNIADIKSSIEGVFNRISHKLSGQKELDLNSFKAFYSLAQ